MAANHIRLAHSNMISGCASSSNMAARRQFYFRLLANKAVSGRGQLVNPKADIKLIVCSRKKVIDD